LPIADEFELRFERAITIILGENGTGKSTLLEGIAARSPAMTRQVAARATGRSIMPMRSK
jgi:predicted ATPase